MCTSLYYTVDDCMKKRYQIAEGYCLFKRLNNKDQDRSCVYTM